MQFKDLVAKLDELVGTTPNARPTAQQAIQAAQTAQAGQTDPQAQTPPAEKPIPGQQPNLGPKTVVPQAPPQQVIGAQPAPAQQNQQANGGMAAAILQAVNQMKTQQPNLAPTSSQSIANQQQQAVTQAKGLQQTAKPGEPLEEVQVDEWGEWLKGSKSDAGKKEKPSQKDLDDAGVDKWARTLSSDPNNIKNPNWSNVSPASKQKIIDALAKTDPNAANYIEAIRKYDVARKQENPNEEDLKTLEKERSDARLKWSGINPETGKKEKEPANKEPVIRDPREPKEKKKDGQVVANPAAEEPKIEKPKADKPKASVTAAELQKFRDEQGNQNITLGQYLNYKNKLTAIKGSANDPEVIQKRLGDKGTAWDPTVKKPEAIVNNDEDDDINKAVQTAQDKNMRRDTLVRMMRNAGSSDEDIKGALAKQGLEFPSADDAPNTVEPVALPSVGTRTDNGPGLNTVQQSPAPLSPEPVKDNPAVTSPAEKSSGYKVIKKDATGKSYIDLFNIGQDFSATNKSNSLGAGDGAPMRGTEVKSVKESMQELVDEMLAEDATLPMTQPRTSTWSKARDIATQASDTVTSAIPKPIRNAATAVSNIPGVGKATRMGLGTMGALGAVGDATDAYDRFQKGDYKGAAIRGLGAVGGVAQMAKHPLAVGLGLATQQGADWYLDKLDAEKSGITKEDDELQELYDIIQLSGKLK